MVNKIVGIYFPLITLERLENYGKVFKCLKENPQADDCEISKRTRLFIGDVRMFRLMIEGVDSRVGQQEENKVEELTAEKITRAPSLEKKEPVITKEPEPQIFRPTVEEFEAIVVKPAPKIGECHHQFITTYSQYDMHGDIRSVVRTCTKCGYAERTHTG